MRPCPCDYQEAYRLVLREPEFFSRIDGLFAQADIIAFGALAGLKELGLTVPGGIRIVGFDDSPLCQMPHPALSSIHQPREDLARAAAGRLKELLEGSERPPEKRLLAPRLEARGSSQP